MVDVTVGILAPGIDFDLLNAVAISAGYRVVVPRNLDLTGVCATVVHAFAHQRTAWLEAARTASCPVVLCSAPGADAPIPRQGHTEPCCTSRVVGLTGDGYVWRERLLEEALRYALAEDRAQRLKGPSRLVFLGHGGADHTRSGCAPSIGESFTLGAEPIFIGRATQSRVTIGFSTSVARGHARVSREPSGQVVIEDLGSTNGTYLRGKPISGPTVLQLGDEVAVAGFLRLRLDGGLG